MIVLVIIGVMLGSSFGFLRFSVFALVPATAAAIGLAGLLGLAHHAPISSIIIAMLSAGVALQLGYLGGASCRVLRIAAAEAIRSGRARSHWPDSTRKQLRSSTGM